jgi:membrane protease YdiL (CAAX protease family)
MFTQLSNLSKAWIFYGLAFGMALLLALFGQGIGDTLNLVTMFTSAAAVLLTLLVVTRDGYTRIGWEILGLHRLGLRTWSWAIGGPLLVMGVTYTTVWTTGLGRLDTGALRQMFTLDSTLNIVANIGITLIAVLAEEIGWRGYLLPNLAKIGRVRAMLLSGFLHGLWHLPLMLLTPFYHAEGNRIIVVGLFLLTLTAAGLFYGYLRLFSESVWPATIAHTVLNITWGTLAAVTIPLASPVLLEYLAGESGLITLVQVAVLSVWLLYRHQRKEEKTPTRQVVVGRVTA